MNKPNPKEKRRLIEWDRIELAYMDGDLMNPSIPPTFQFLSENFNVSRQAISRRAIREHWNDRRNRQRANAIDRVAEQKARDKFKQLADSLSDINKHLDTTEETLGKMLRDGVRTRIIQTKTGPKTISENLTPQDYKIIIATLRDIAKSKRELLDKASIEALRYDHQTALINYAKTIVGIIKDEIGNNETQLRIFKRIAEATRSPE